MKLKLTGVALGALMVGLVGAGQAKADAVATATINVTGAFFSLDQAGTQGVDFTSLLSTVTGNNTVFAEAGLGTVGGTETVLPGATPDSSYSDVPSSFQGTVQSTATLNSGASQSTATATLIGSLLTAQPNGTAGTSTGAVTSSVTSSDTLVNGSISNSNTAKNLNTTQVSFMANATTNLWLQLGDVNYTLLAQTFNSNNSGQKADASMQLFFSLTNNTDTSQGVQSFNILPGLVAQVGANVVGINQSSGPGFVDLGALQNEFSLIGGDTYTLNITEVVTTDAKAVPEPGTLALFGAGLAGLGFFGFRRQKRSGGFAA